MKVGYVRVSTQEQNTARQDVLMSELGVEKVYVDKQSGKSAKDRKQLQEMLGFIREGDTVVVESISRLARNTKDLLDIVEQIKNKGANLIIQKEGCDTSTPVGHCMLTIFGAMAQLERDYIRERQAEGIAIAKAEGKYTGRKAIEFDEEVFKDLYKQWRSGEITLKGAAKKLNMSVRTLQRRIADYEEEYLKTR